jgi:hypothetical protein
MDDPFDESGTQAALPPRRAGFTKIGMVTSMLIANLYCRG